MTLNEFRHNGFWIINKNPAVGSRIYHCVTFRKLRGKLGEQKIADLTEERSSDEAPFTYVVMDTFVPFVTKEGRKELKRYGAIFTCLASRAIHLEVVNSIDTDSFVMCLKRFIGCRENVRMLWCDNRRNFIGAEKELSRGFLEMDQNKIRRFLQNSGSDWIIWKKNPPAGSHFREFGSAKSGQQGQCLNHYSQLMDPA